MNNADLIITEPAETYHGKKGRYLSSHALTDFRACPAFYLAKRNGLVPDRDTDEYKLGRATHALGLEGRDVYEREFLVGNHAPINKTTGKPYKPPSQKYEDWVASEPRAILTDHEGMLVERMALAIKTHPAASYLIDGNGTPEAVVRAECYGRPCQIRIDYLTAGGTLVDLKTTKNLDGFAASINRYGYAHQSAFYRDVARAAGLNLSGVSFIVAVEKDEKNRCGVFALEPAVLDRASAENAAAVQYLSMCEHHDHWPTGYEDVRAFTLSDFAPKETA